MDFNILNDFASHITQGTTEIIKKYFRKEYSIDFKTDNSPVTIVDRLVEEFLIEAITKEFPSHSVVGEEFGASRDGSDYKWIIDPIDGTKSFIHGTPLFATIIGLLKDEEPVFGIYHNAILGDLLTGDNQQCIYNGKSIKMRQCRKLSDASLLTTDHFSIGKFYGQKQFDELVQKCKLYRTWGDAYGYFLLATGYADIMIDPIMSPWDSLPLIPIIAGAGGVVTDYTGDCSIKGNSIVAASADIHEQVIKILNIK
jgi:myo-inositol-1(or 4)-monophosphatase